MKHIKVMLFSLCKSEPVRQKISGSLDTMKCGPAGLQFEGVQAAKYASVSSNFALFYTA